MNIAGKILRGAEMPTTIGGMILRELLREYGITTLTEFARRADLKTSHAWNLWHGRAKLGLQLMRKLSQTLGIPITRLIDLQETPPTPYQGKGGPRKYRKRRRKE
jgi:transcriptional regulator with XRE-family HTH domain